MLPPSARLLRPAFHLFRRLHSLPHRPSRPLPLPHPSPLPSLPLPLPHHSPSHSPSPYLLPSLLAFFLSISTPTPSHADTSPPTPSPTTTWPSVIRQLLAAQHRLSLPCAFVANRRPLDPDDTSWLFQLEFPAAPAADLYAVLVTLAAALQAARGAEDAVFTVEQTPTRTVLTVAEEHAFEIAVTVPRLSPFQTSVVVELTKTDGPDATFSTEEVDALVRAYYLAQATPRGLSAQVPMNAAGLLDGKDSVDIGPPTAIDRSRTQGTRPGKDPRSGDYEGYGAEQGVRGEGGAQLVAKRARTKLEELGVDVFDGEESGLTWDALAGYDDVKERIENTLTLPLKHPDVYENIVRGTRKRFESNLPKAVLYEGPPGCGKTLSAKILSVSIGVPFVHVPLETILSKFYGETTRKLAEILQTANDLGPCLVFIDECDSIGLSRSSSTEVHEVTRRTLSVLLRHIDGLDGPQNTILLAATNHKEDIDPALMSRFDVVVSFPLPDLDTRVAVLALYAKHLSQEELKTMAEMSAGFSGRELLDVCEEAERTYAGHIVRESVSGNRTEGSQTSEQLPRLPEYVAAIERKAPHVVGRTQHWQNGHPGEQPTGQSMTVGPTPALTM